MVTDIFQFALWSLLGFIITWGIFLAWLGFRKEPRLRAKRLSKLAEVFTLVVGVLWIMIWVTACFINVVQIWSGDSTWHPIPLPSQSSILLR